MTPERIVEIRLMPHAWCDRNRPRLVRLLAACLREIDRLRGAQ